MHISDGKKTDALDSEISSVPLVIPSNKQIPIDKVLKNPSSLKGQRKGPGIVFLR